MILLNAKNYNVIIAIKTLKTLKLLLLQWV